MASVSQPAHSRTAKDVLVGAGIVAATAGAGALVAYLNESGSGETFKGLAALGGAMTGSTAAGLGGLVVAAASKKHRKTALATAALGLGGVAALILGSVVTKALSPGPTPPQVTPGTTPLPASNIPWTQIPLTTTLQPQVIYRLSDVATASELASPPSVAATQASLGSAFQVDGVWTGTPPQGWVPADSGANNRVYVQFFVTSAAQLPVGLTSDARLYVQRANV